ncbi:RNA dependent RNA polymerase-domain-containing protein [Glomus cerebriforme]|uniref:RNA-dependent RNA polymerase n=1 Tax=Glomus cerebriforme TaxID=658196 RepID=A0A397SF93_9GLOM|nr:RNA dependent RNA polymerase-domain-containing protein [Glomus cerebriforme]
MAKVYVKNIPYKANKTVLINALSAHGYGPISNCELKMHKTKINCNAGSGYVEFENEKDADFCIAKAPFVRPTCLGRPLYIHPVKPKKKVETMSDTNEIETDFFLSSFEIGNWSTATHIDKKKKSNNQQFTFSCKWKYPEDYEKSKIIFSKTEEAFILEGFKGSDSDSVKRRVKIPFRNLAENSRGIFLDSTDDVISLYISCKQPPYLYRKGGGGVIEFMELMSLINLRGRQSRNIEWIRTIDWTGVFGRCLVYRLIFRDNLDNLRNTLDKFKFKGIPRIPQIMIKCVENPGYSTDSENFICELLPFNICFKLESLISYGILRPYEIEEYKLGERLGELIHNGNQGEIAMHVLNQISTKYWDPFDEKHKDRPISIFENALKNFRNWHPSNPLKNTSRCVWVNHATITPTNIYYDGPNYESSNRILRLYKDKTDYFLRVTFREENFERLFLNKDEDVDIIDLRIMDIIKNGFHLVGRHYEFLIFSASQLKETSCWFVASDGDTFNANFIRANMGDFSDIRGPALYAARMGQCFTSTMGILVLDREQIKPLDEIKRDEHKFSDGCGKISPGLAKLAAKEYWGTKNKSDKEIPSVFQIRLGGCKGVVAVDPNLKDEGNVLYIRPSQTKFEAPTLNLEIVKTLKTPLPGHLNRQIILLLSTLGVKDDVFITLQEEMRADIDLMMTNEEKAYQIIKRSTGTRECSHITRTIISMIDAGMMRKKTFDPFLKALLECKRIFALKLLRYKARILVPNSFLLIGVVDETGILEENQIYVQTSTIISEYQTFNAANNKVQREKKVWTSTAIITRNPCLHPGDLRIVEAVDVPELSHLKNCVVFSQKGYKPLPNLLSGGDLDGDEYFVSFDERIRITKNEEPMNYDPPVKKTLDRPVEITDICEFFKDFMINNRLGQISNLHVALADIQDEGVKFIGCKILATLHSKAVDFNKTGVPVTETLPNLEKYPDFMEKANKISYKSEKILGKLYRNIQFDKSENVPLLNYDVENITLDEEFLFNGYEHYLEEALIYRDYYNNQIRNLMKKYRVKTEAEIIAAQLLGKQVEGKKSQDIREAIGGTISFIIYDVRKQFLMGLGLQDINDDNDIDDITPFNLHVSIPISDEAKAKASAWYYVTYNQEEYPDQGENVLLSFPWVVADILLAIIH